MQLHTESKNVSEHVGTERAARPESQIVVDRRREKGSRLSGTIRVPCKRFQVWCAELDVRTMLFGVVPALWSSHYELLNLSKGGLAYEARSPVASRTRVRLQLWVPDFADAVAITGETRWCKRMHGRLYTVGVQFDPFGEKVGMNSPAVLDALRALEQKYG